MQKIVVLVLAFLATSSLPGWADCPLALRSYEDAEGRDFLLEFDPPPPDRPVQQVGVATLLHSTRGKIFEFEVYATSGYGRVSLVRGEHNHTAYFFTEDLRSTKTELDSRLLFIDGLGAADWMLGPLPDSREFPLGDTIWRLAGCKE